MEIVTGQEIRRMLVRVGEGLGSYSEVLLCSPFMDAATIREVGELMYEARNSGCDMHVITRAEAAYALLKYVARTARRSPIHVVKELHAKVYWARSRCGKATEAIVTSTNLTRCGMQENFELGVRFVSSIELDRGPLVDIRRHVHNWLQ